MSLETITKQNIRNTFTDDLGFGIGRMGRKWRVLPSSAYRNVAVDIVISYYMLQLSKSYKLWAPCKAPFYIELPWGALQGAPK